MLRTFWTPFSAYKLLVAIAPQPHGKCGCPDIPNKPLPIIESVSIEPVSGAAPSRDTVGSSTGGCRSCETSVSPKVQAESVSCSTTPSGYSESSARGSPGTLPPTHGTAEKQRLATELLEAKNGCYILKYKQGNSDPEEFLKYISGLDVRIIAEYKKSFRGVHVCTSQVDAAKKMAAHRLLEHIEEDHVYTASCLSPYLPKHLYLMRNYKNYILNNYILDSVPLRYLPTKFLQLLFSQGHEYGSLGEGVDVYLVDTSVDPAFPDLRGRVSNMYGEEPLCNAHGARVAALIAGTDMGIAKLSRIRVLNVVDCRGNVRLSKLLSGLESLKVPNNGRSVLMFGVSGPFSSTLNDLVADIARTGVPIVAPAGNNGSPASEYSPGSSKHVVSVGSVNKYARISKFSNYGDSVSMYSLGEGAEFCPGSYRGATMHGTSMSAALVTGALALLLEETPGASQLQVRDFLSKNSFRMGCGYRVQEFPHLGLALGRKSGPRRDSGWVTILQDNLGLFVLLAVVAVFLVLHMRRRNSTAGSNDSDLYIVPPIDRGSSI